MFPRKGGILSLRRMSILASIVTTGLLLFSTPTAVFSAAPQTGASNWFMNGNFGVNNNYSNQTQINPTNAGTLVPKWIFPIPQSPEPWASASEGAQEGVVSTVMIVGGVAYFVTNWYRIYAVSATTGSTIWVKDIPLLNMTTLNYECHHGALGCGITYNTHVHNDQIAYTTQVLGRNLFWFATPDYQIYAFDPLLGDTVVHFNWFDVSDTAALHASHSFGVFDVLSGAIFTIDQKRGIIVIGDETADCQCEPRGFIEGWNVLSNPPTQLWKSFLMPPQDGTDPNWSINSVGNMTHAWIFNGTGAVDLKALSQTTLHDVLYNDWGNDGFNGTRSYGGVGVNWGGPWAVDPASGLVYASTAQPSPDQNATYRPGPNLWSDSILGINDQTGKYVWGFQSTPHDLIDWDCSWATILANVTIGGTLQPEIIKGCKNGYLYGLNAATGALNWFLLPPSEKRFCSPGCGTTPGVPPNIDSPLNSSAMHRPWINYPDPDLKGQTTLKYNCPTTGCIESDPAYDPTLNYVFVATFNLPVLKQIGTPIGPGTSYVKTTIGGSTSDTQHANTTIYAVDATTGKAIWSTYVGAFGFRGGMSVSNGVLYAQAPDGTIKLLNEKTGQLFSSIFIGTPMNINPGIGTDTNGNVELILPAAANAAAFAGASPQTPGFVVALGLSPSAATVTTTVAGAPGATVTTTVGGAPGATVTTTVGGAPGATVTSTQIQTTTLQTGASGIDPTTFYAVAGVAVIALIAAGFFAMRRRKP